MASKMLDISISNRASDGGALINDRDISIDIMSISSSHYPMHVVKRLDDRDLNITIDHFVNNLSSELPSGSSRGRSNSS